MKFPRNPFPVAGSIRQCWLFAYRVPEAVAKAKVPPPLRLVTHGGYAFMNIVVCRLSGMRPALLPAEVGLGYWHVAYRWHGWAPTSAGTRIEGLYFARSDCDRWIVEQAGNILTDFHFHRAKIALRENADGVEGVIKSADARARFRIDRRAIPALADASPFTNLDEASAFLKYKPFGLSVQNADTLQAIRIRREESAWRAHLVAVPEAQWQFLDGFGSTLEVCYEVEPIEYRWERGQIVRVVPCV